MKISKNIVLKGKILDFDTPRVMTIINITPDSFFEGSRASSSDDILWSVEKAVAEGASIIDIGGYSTRPNAAFVSEAEEIHRVTSALEVVRRNYADLPISVDTFRARVAEIAVDDYEADIINDVSGGTLDDNMLPTMAKLNVPYILMHMRGNDRAELQTTRQPTGIRVFRVADTDRHFSQIDDKSCYRHYATGGTQRHNGTEHTGSARRSRYIARTRHTPSCGSNKTRRVLSCRLSVMKGLLTSINYVINWIKMSNFAELFFV